MVKKIIIAGFMGLYLCTPHIKAEDIQTALMPSQETQAAQESADQKRNEPTLETKSEPVSATFTFDQRYIDCLIAFCVDLAFSLYERSTAQDHL